MKKPDSLRTMLLQAVPFLAGDPTKLSLFIDQGRVAARATGSLSFEYRYKLNLLVMDYAGDVDALMVPILAWIAEQQPDLLERGEQEPFTFESEILDADSADVSIEIELTERVIVERQPKGLKVTHLDEPSRADAFPDVEGVRLWQGLLDDGGTAPLELVP